jgi:hypothetical protein
LFSVDRIVHAVLTHHGLLLTPSDFERYSELEAMLQAWVTGSLLPAAKTVPDESFRRPIQWHLPGGLPWQEAAIEEEQRQHAAIIAVERRQLTAAIAEERDLHAAEIASLRNEITVLSERAELAERNYNLMRYSISWRLTAPFRRIMGLLPSRLRGRLRQGLKALSGRG